MIAERLPEQATRLRSFIPTDHPRSHVSSTVGAVVEELVKL